MVAAEKRISAKDTDIKNRIEKVIQETGMNKSELLDYVYEVLTIEREQLGKHAMLSFASLERQIGDYERQKKKRKVKKRLTEKNRQGLTEKK